MEVTDPAAAAAEATPTVTIAVTAAAATAAAAVVDMVEVEVAMAEVATEGKFSLLPTFHQRNHLCAATNFRSEQNLERSRVVRMYSHKTTY